MTAVPRIPIPRPQLALVLPPASDESLDSFGRARAKRPRGVSQKRFDEALARAAAMAASGDWSGAKAIDFVALFSAMHERVYGVAPALSPAERLKASFVAAATMRAHFGNEPQELADFVWWTWKREKEREKFRRENGREGGSISWALQFSGRLLTDYRIAMARESARGK